MRKFIGFWLVVAVGSLATSIGVANENIRFHGTQLGRVQVEKIVSGIDTPWAMAMLPDGELIVTERDGRMFHVDASESRRLTEISGVPDVWANGQGGLLDVVLDPDFENNQTLYFTYSDPAFLRGAGTAIASAKLVLKPSASLEDVEVLFSMDKTSNAGVHFGSRIVPDGKGNLWFTIGDRGQPNRAQDPKDAAGSVMRIRTDGGIPADNPFADGREGLPQLWSTGHRNPQGATLNDETGALWTLAHGAKGGDEINIPEAGKNYGWPVISYGVNYSGTKIGIGTEAEGYEQPIYYWDPSIAPSGLDFYQGKAVPFWQGHLFLGALKFQTIVRLEVSDDKVLSEERLFEGEYGRVRDVRSFPDGALWFLTNDGEGSIYRVTAAE